MAEPRTVYFGPAYGMYSSSCFHDFVTIDLARKLRDEGFPGSCNPEPIGNGTMYHFPKAGIGVAYAILLGGQRCKVNLVGTQPRTLEIVTNFIFAEDNKKAKEREEAKPA